MVNELLLVFVKLELTDDKRISFDYLAGCKAQRESRFFSVILQKMTDAVQTAMNCTASLGSVAEILTKRLFLIFCDMYGVLDKFVDTEILRSGYRYDRHT